MDSTWQPQGMIGAFAVVARRSCTRSRDEPEQQRRYLGQAAPDGPIHAAHLRRHHQPEAHLVGRRTLAGLSRERDHNGGIPADSPAPTAPALRRPCSARPSPSARRSRRTTASGWCVRRSFFEAGCGRHLRGPHGRLDARAAGDQSGDGDRPRGLTRRAVVGVRIGRVGGAGGVRAPVSRRLSARWQVSAAGGTDPVWSHSGKELFYRSAQDALMSVVVRPGATFTFEQPKPLFSTAAYLPAPRCLVRREPGRQTVSVLAGDGAERAERADRGAELDPGVEGAGGEVTGGPFPIFGAPEGAGALRLPRVGEGVPPKATSRGARRRRLSWTEPEEGACPPSADGSDKTRERRSFATMTLSQAISPSSTPGPTPPAAPPNPQRARSHPAEIPSDISGSRARTARQALRL